MRLENKTAIVTGGGSGFGAGIARRFAATMPGRAIRLTEGPRAGATRVCRAILWLPEHITGDGFDVERLGKHVYRGDPIEPIAGICQQNGIAGQAGRITRDVHYGAGLGCGDGVDTFPAQPPARRIGDGDLPVLVDVLDGIFCRGGHYPILIDPGPIQIGVQVGGGESVSLDGNYPPGALPDCGSEEPTPRIGVEYGVGGLRCGGSGHQPHQFCSPRRVVLEEGRSGDAIGQAGNLLVQDWFTTDRLQRRRLVARERQRAAVEQERLRAEAAVVAAPAELRLNGPAGAGGLHRIGDVPIYAVDALCRRSAPLQQTAHAANDWLGLNPADAGRLGLADGAMARVSQGGQSAEFEVRVSEKVPEGGAWLRSATWNCADRAT